MSKLRHLLTAATALLLGAATPAAPAQPDWPGKTLTLVVPYSAGGTSDILGHTLGEILREAHGTTVIIEHRPGAGGSLGADAVARARPDGATLLLSATSPLVIFPHLVKTTYDPLRDLVPLASVAVGPVAILATRSLHVRDFAGLVDHVHRYPGRLAYAVPGVGSVAHVGMAHLNRRLDLDMLQVPYKGGSKAVFDGLGGVVDLLVVNTDITLPHVRAGTLKPLAVMAPERLEAWPDVPTMADLGMPEVRYYSNFGLFAPTGMPANVVNAVQSELAEALADPRFQETLRRHALQPGTGIGPDFASQVRADYERNRLVIQQAGIHAQ
ncbi:Bug family tripartite tricarboxylate transporter substrate binding protein [Bordetella sp. 2513F-2]